MNFKFNSCLLKSEFYPNNLLQAWHWKFWRLCYESLLHIWLFSRGNEVFHWIHFVHNAQQCFAFTPQANFPAHNLNFHWRWRWWDQIQATFKNLLYFALKAVSCSAGCPWFQVRRFHATLIEIVTSNGFSLQSNVGIEHGISRWM